MNNSGENTDFSWSRLPLAWLSDSIGQAFQMKHIQELIGDDQRHGAILDSKCEAADSQERILHWPTVNLNKHFYWMCGLAMWAQNTCRWVVMTNWRKSKPHCHCRILILKAWCIVGLLNQTALEHLESLCLQWKRHFRHEHVTKSVVPLAFGALAESCGIWFTHVFTKCTQTHNSAPVKFDLVMLMSSLVDNATPLMLTHMQTWLTTFSQQAACFRQGMKEVTQLIDALSFPRRKQGNWGEKVREVLTLSTTLEAVNIEWGKDFKVILAEVISSPFFKVDCKSWTKRCVRDPALALLLVMSNKTMRQAKEAHVKLVKDNVCIFLDLQNFIGSSLKVPGHVLCAPLRSWLVWFRSLPVLLLIFELVFWKFSSLSCPRCWFRACIDNWTFFTWRQCCECTVHESVDQSTTHATCLLYTSDAADE